MSDKKYFNWLVLAGLFLIFLIAALVISQEAFKKEKSSLRGKEIREVKIGENIFQAEIAATPEERKQGLSFRQELCENCAMLFLFGEEGRPAFWMKGMNFDLDMLWIDKDAVVFMAKNVSREKELESIRPDREADKVLEINAGLADKLGIKIGNKVEF
jgi:hypothetical protein